MAPRVVVKSAASASCPSEERRRQPPKGSSFREWAEQRRDGEARQGAPEEFATAFAEEEAAQAASSEEEAEQASRPPPRERAPELLEAARQRRARARPPQDERSVFQGHPSARDEEECDSLWFRVVGGEMLAVRRQPRFGSMPVGVLFRGEIVEAREAFDGWVNLGPYERSVRRMDIERGSDDAWAPLQGALTNRCHLELYVALFWEVVHTGKVAVRKSASVRAPAIEWLEPGAVFSVDAVWGGWVALSAAEREFRDVSDCCGAWVLIDSDRCGRLLRPCPEPDNEPAELGEDDVGFSIPGEDDSECDDDSGPEVMAEPGRGRCPKR